MAAFVAGDTVLLTRLHSNQQTSRFAQTFNRVQPAALGTVQIMLGLWFFLQTVVFAINDGSSTGVYWGSLMYVAAGALTVAAGKSDSFCLMKACLVLNVLAAIWSFLAILALCFFGTLVRAYDDRPQVQMIVLLLFHFLEICVAISVAVFASKASCDCCRPVSGRPLHDCHCPEEVVVLSTAPAEAPPPDVETQPIAGKRDEPDLPPAYSEISDQPSSAHLMTS